MAQRSAIGKAALPPQTEPGTARGLAKQVQVRSSIFTKLRKNRLPFPCSIVSFLTRPHPPPTAATPSSTQNAPGFALLGLFRVRFAAFSGSNFLGRNLCFLPSVIGGQPVL